MARHKRRWPFWNIFIYLLIFIVGSLIVTFLVSPNSLDNLTENVKVIFNNLFLKVSGTGGVDEKFIEHTKTPMQYRPKCTTLEEGGAYIGLGGNAAKVNECRSYCGIDNREYHHYECRANNFYCYCSLYFPN